MKGLGLLLALVLTSACAGRNLPPHVWLPVQNLEGVDRFWWTDQRICQLRVIWWDRDTPKSFTVTVDPWVCVEGLKAEGYKVLK